MSVGEQRGRLAVRERSQGRCELGLRGCLRQAQSWSHRLPAGAGGTWAPWNGLDSCGDGVRGCHGRIESERTWAYERGLLVPRGVDPVVVPVQLHHPVYGAAWWLLSREHGDLRWVAPYDAPLSEVDDAAAVLLAAA